MMLLMRFVTEEDGQDLIEYALLTAVDWTLCGRGIQFMERRDRKTYNGWNTSATGYRDPEPKP